METRARLEREAGDVIKLADLAAPRPSESSGQIFGSEVIYGLFRVPGYCIGMLI